MKSDLSILSLVLNASLLVQLVMLLLLSISLASWTTIDEPDWIEARDAYAKFALAGAWKA